MSDLDFKELAKKQYKELRQESLNEDRDCIGAKATREYDNFSIEVDGLWDRSNWFDYKVIKGGKIIEKESILLD